MIFPASCYSIPFKTKYSPRYRILEQVDSRSWLHVTDQMLHTDTTDFLAISTITFRPKTSLKNLLRINMTINILVSGGSTGSFRSHTSFVSSMPLSHLVTKYSRKYKNYLHLQ